MLRESDEGMSLSAAMQGNVVEGGFLRYGYPRYHMDAIPTHRLSTYYVYRDLGHIYGIMSLLYRKGLLVRIACNLANWV